MAFYWFRNLSIMFKLIPILQKFTCLSKFWYSLHHSNVVLFFVQLETQISKKTLYYMISYWTHESCNNATEIYSPFSCQLKAYSKVNFARRWVRYPVPDLVYEHVMSVLIIAKNLNLPIWCCNIASIRTHCWWTSWKMRKSDVIAELYLIVDYWMKTDEKYLLFFWHGLMVYRNNVNRLFILFFPAQRWSNFCAEIVVQLK